MIYELHSIILVAVIFLSMLISGCGGNSGAPLNGNA